MIIKRLISVCREAVCTGRPGGGVEEGAGLTI